MHSNTCADSSCTGKNEETRAFYDAYQRDLVDDEPMEFGPPEEDRSPVDEEEAQETISRAEVTKRAREVARAGEVGLAVASGQTLSHYCKQTFAPLAPNDVSWVDGESEDEDHQGLVIREAAPAKKATVLPRTALTQVDFDFNLEVRRRPRSFLVAGVDHDDSGLSGRSRRSTNG
jgi:mediator of replication checkpoint protein 1